jgi:hypothetical protein
LFSNAALCFPASLITTTCVVQTAAAACQAILLGGWQDVMSAQAPLPAAYACKRLATPVQLPAEMLPDEDQQDPSSSASEVIIHLMKTTGTLVYLALLHGLPAIFQASTQNVLTGVCWTANGLNNHKDSVCMVHEVKHSSQFRQKKLARRQYQWAAGLSCMVNSCSLDPGHC